APDGPHAPRALLRRAPLPPSRMERRAQPGALWPVQQPARPRPQLPPGGLGGGPGGPPHRLLGGPGPAGPRPPRGGGGAAGPPAPQSRGPRVRPRRPGPHHREHPPPPLETRRAAPGRGAARTVAASRERGLLRRLSGPV
ncbi:MAG: 6-pyruvoyl tetrahydrobiopterin synthase, partial [uncultured Gemmatimonadetes bacterium]